jgi:hypothetical protein
VALLETATMIPLLTSEMFAAMRPELLLVRSAYHCCENMRVSCLRPFKNTHHVKTSLSVIPDMKNVRVR